MDTPHTVTIHALPSQVLFAGETQTDSHFVSVSPHKLIEGGDKEEFIEHALTVYSSDVVDSERYLSMTLNYGDSCDGGIGAENRRMTVHWFCDEAVTEIEDGAEVIEGADKSECMPQMNIRSVYGCPVFMNVSGPNTTTTSASTTTSAPFATTPSPITSIENLTDSACNGIYQQTKVVDVANDTVFDVKALVFL